MQIEVNFTIVIQIINFLIAYFLIAKFFLKPSLLFLDKRDAYKESLDIEMESLNKKIELNNLNIEQMWNNAKVKFTHSILSVSFISKFKNLKINSIKEYFLSEHEEKQLVTDICKELVNKAEDVNS
jgi:anaerobic C4-dicarboxylate transporter